MSRTVARPVTGAGWGRWTTILSPPFISPTRDPDRSTTSTPLARSMASTSAHRRSAGAGLSQTRAKVLRCLLRMARM